MLRIRSATALTRSPWRPLPSIWKIPFLVETRSAPARSLLPSQLYFLSRKSLSWFPGFLIPISSCAAWWRRLFRRGRRNRHASRVRSPDPWNPWLSGPSLIRVHSCGFVVDSENLKKFSLNPVEGTSTSASMCSLLWQKAQRQPRPIARMHRLRKNK